MNIFRILAQGDGSIQEPNISAFLGYLLNPNEDHGLGSRFLEPFLQQHCIQAKANSSKYNLEWLYKEDRIIDLSTASNYEINVFFEQAFSAKNLADVPDETSDKSKKEVVDIILIIHEVEKQKREKYFENYLRNERILKHIFLIEVKISDNAVKLDDDKGKEGQLKAQVKGSKDEIKKLLKNSKIKFNTDEGISSIFVTPDSKNREKTRAHKAFEDLKKQYKHLLASQIFWNTTNDEMPTNIDNKDTKDSLKDNKNVVTHISIEQMLDDIIKPKPEDKPQPLPQYTIDTLQSFSNFIYSGFSYKQKRQKGDRKNDGSYTKEYVELNEKTNIEEKLKTLRKELIKKNKSFTKILSEPNFKDKRHPKLILSINNINIHISTFSNNRDKVRFDFIADSKHYKESLIKLKKIASKNKIEIKNENKGGYCRTIEMNKGIKIDDFDTIYNRLQETIKLTII